MDKELEQISVSMVQYLVTFGKEKLIDKIKTNTLNEVDIKQLITLFKLDTQAIILAVEYGVHPITGCVWDMDKRYYASVFTPREIELVGLLKRNNKFVKSLEKELLKLKMKEEKDLIFESPDGGITVYSRKSGDYEHRVRVK